MKDNCRKNKRIMIGGIKQKIFGLVVFTIILIMASYTAVIRSASLA